MKTLAALLAGAATLAACATDVTQRAVAVELVEPSAPASFELLEEVRLRLPAARSSGLPEGSLWNAAGSLPQGTVYRPRDVVLQVHTGHAYEAWLVVEGEHAVGVYLPVQEAFLEAASPTPLKRRPLP